MGLDLTPLALTRKLLSFNTINPPGNERDCATYIGHLLAEAGLEVRTYEFDRKRTTVIARVRGDGSNPPICFSGHLDTVPLGAAAWSKDPFAGEVDGDRVYGRGASDMKAGVAAMVLMARRLAKTPELMSGMTLVLTAGEETGCAGAHHVAQLGDVLGEAGAIIVGEPTSNYPIIGHKGCIRFEITTRGITAHAAMPEQGENAILKALQVIAKLQEFDFNVSPDPLLGTPTLNVGTISGGINVNSVPDKTTIGIDIRTIPGQDHDEIQQAIQTMLGEDVEIKPTRSARSIATDSKHEWIQEVFDIMEAFLHERPEAAAVGYFTDASVLKAAYGDPPTLILGPGEPTVAHKTDEFCAISKIEEATEAYIEIAKRWCSR